MTSARGGYDDGYDSGFKAGQAKAYNELRAEIKALKAKLARRKLD